MAAATKAELEAFAAEARAAITALQRTDPTASYTATLEARLVGMETALTQLNTSSATTNATGITLQQQFSAVQSALAQQRSELNNLHTFTHEGFNNLQSEVAAKGKGKGGDGGHGWQMTRPKDMMPNVFNGSEAEWPAWRESVEDYLQRQRHARSE